MPWTEDDAPLAWKNQPADVRGKAIAIGNALLAEGMDEGRAIPIALAQARKAIEGDDGQWVVPHARGWAVKTTHAERASRVFRTQREAIDHAVSTAQERGTTVTVLRKDGTIRGRQSFRSRL